jgi:flagellin
MSLVINTNVASLNAQRNLGSNTVQLGKTLEKLASGFRINRSSDDAAGLQISENLRSQIRGIGVAINNAQDGTNMLSVAEGTLSVVQDNLQRIRELAVQAANDTNGTTQRNAISQEIQARMDDIDRITQATQFNGTSILASGLSTMFIQVGANNSSTLDRIDVTSALGKATSSSLGLSTNVSFANNSAALAFLATVDTALDNVSSKRAKIGAFQNRLESAINNLQITRENFESSESRIRNVDVANESAKLAKFQILQQAAASILAQANQSPQLALSLLR